MAEPTPKPEQQAAVAVPGAAAIRAGAGTGKTAVLARRFLELLRPRDGAAPLIEEVGQLLAITFTEKAAAEMKARIRKLLAEALATAPAAARPRWERIRRELLGAQISTIHAFCARVVRENPLEASVDPHAVVLDESEGRGYLEGVVEELLVGRLRAGDPAARALLLRCRRLRGGRDGGAVGFCLRALTWLGVTGRDDAWLAAALARQEALAPVAVMALRAGATRIAEVVRAALAGGARRKAAVARLAERWPAWESALRDLGPASPPAALRPLEDLWTALRDARLHDAVRADLELVDGRLRGTVADEYGFLCALPETRALVGLVGVVAATVAARKRADAVLTFDDLVTEARALFARHPAVLQRYAGRFCAVLVDEFQDTDAVQAEVIRLLAAAGATLFVVGDEKQSIYRFRGADVAVFHEMRRTLGRELTLGINFRSVPGILDFVNALATRTLRVPSGAADPKHWTAFEPADRLVPDRAAVGPDPAVRLVTFAPTHVRKTLRAAEARELEGRVLAEVVADLGTAGYAWGDVAVLFRTLNQVKAYEYALRRREIPYYVVKGRGFFQCQEVRDVTSLLAAVADPHDEVALAAALRSPFFAVDDDTLARLAWTAGATRPHLGRRFRAGETFADLPGEAPALARVRDLLLHLRRLRSRATIAELIGEALAATDFEAVCLTQFQGAQKVANVRKLIELGRGAERRRYAGLREFVRWAREATEREPREPEAQLVGEQDDVVRLMTIHQAKGLEFRVVVLVDLGRPLDRDWSAVVLDDDLGVVAAPVEGAGAFPLRHARLEDCRRRELDRARAEHARLLYVACTRARDLVVLLEGKGDPRYLEAEPKGDPYVWCHQIWDLLGRKRMAAFARGEEAETTVVLPGGGTVRVERADRWAGRAAAAPAPPPEPAEAPASVAEVAGVARVLDFVPPAPAEVVTSPTALADFARCPRQYWYRHVLGVAEPGRGGERARVLGTLAHGVLEAIDLAAADAALVARHLAAAPEAPALRPDDRAALADDLVRAAAALRAEVAGGLAVLGREVPFVLPLPAAAPTLILQGRIDLLARRERTLVVRDYKYAASSPAGAAQYGAQLGAYRLAAAGEGEGVAAELVFLRGGPVVWPLPALDATAVEEALVAAGRALGTALARGVPEAFPRRPPAPAACKDLGCPYVRRCWGPGLTGRASDSRSDTAAS